jgi:micrococcal nuclease
MMVVLVLLYLVPALATDLPDPSSATMEARVYKVFDGDTISLKGGEKVRLLGIDTPEIGQPYADEAKRFTKKLVMFKNVRLEFDVQPRDSYDRLLAFVYVETDDGWVLVNAELVRAGLAKLLFIPPNGRYRNYFEQVLHEAMVRHQGMWGKFSDVLTLDTIEANPVSYVTEVVTVRFLVSRVSVTGSGIVLYAGDSRFSFHAIVPNDSFAAFAEAGRDAWEEYAGRLITITGTLQCKDVREGLSVVLTWPDQVTLETE